MSNLAQLLAAIDIAAYPPAVQAFLLATLTSMAADATGINVATSVDGSPLPLAGEQAVEGALNVALFHGVPSAGYNLTAGYSVAVLQDTANGPLLGGYGTTLVTSPSGSDALSGPENGTGTLVAGAGDDTLAAPLGTVVVTSPGGPTSSDSGAVLIASMTGGEQSETDAIFAFGHALVGQGLSNLLFINGSASSTVFGGGGATIDGGTGGGMFKGGGIGNSVIYGGTGASTLFGSGNNDLLLAGGANDDLLIAGYGNETLSGVASTGNSTFYGGGGSDLMGGGSGNQTFFGHGSDTMLGGSGNDTFVGGNGSDTMIAGGGADLFVFNNGLPNGIPELINGVPNPYFNTSAVIENFSSADKVQLQGYASNAVSFALDNAVIAGGRTTVTLPDHTTIVFSGITNLTSAAFM